MSGGWSTCLLSVSGLEKKAAMTVFYINKNFVTKTSNWKFQRQNKQVTCLKEEEEWCCEKQEWVLWEKELCFDRLIFPRTLLPLALAGSAAEWSPLLSTLCWCVTGEPLPTCWHWRGSRTWLLAFHGNSQARGGNRQYRLCCNSRECFSPKQKRNDLVRIRRQGSSPIASVFLDILQNLISASRTLGWCWEHGMIHRDRNGYSGPTNTRARAQTDTCKERKSEGGNKWERRGKIDQVTCINEDMHTYRHTNRNTTHSERVRGEKKKK